jgi:hypothetical protein
VANQTCLDNVFPTMMDRCQVYADRAVGYRPACEADLDKCLNGGGLMAFIRGNKKEEICQENYNRCLDEASQKELQQMEQLKTCRQRAENYCPSRYDRCLTTAQTRETRDRNRYETCYNRAQTEFATCTDKYVNKTEKQAARCIVSAGNCLNRAIKVCSRLK